MLERTLAPRRLALLGLAAILLTPALSSAIEPPAESATRARVFTTPELDVTPSLVHYEMGSARAAAHPDLQGLFARYSSQWEVRYDQRSGRPNVVQGAGIPLLPGRGNTLTLAKAVGHPGAVTLADVEGKVRGFLAEMPELLKVSALDLRLDPAGSVHFGDQGQLWFVELQQFHRGVPVEGAKVYFRINNGNLVQLGAEKVAEVRMPSVKPRVSRERALGAALAAGGFAVSELSEVVRAGDLKILPTLTAGEAPAEAYQGAPGAGYQHLLVWDLSFRRAGDDATYQAVVDAGSGKVLKLADINEYAAVTGGIYPVTNTDPETVVGFPFSNVTNGTTKTTDSAGNYTYGGGTATDTLSGKFIKISDTCGAISKADSATGNLAFGTSGGTDCTTPGSGGAGNTHAARSGFYHLTNINRKAATFFPTNTWLAGTLTANMNVNATCNAFWNGSTVNFYRSGGGCSNTGEIAAVFLHEWGHGMDQNSGGAASDKGTGEAVGDTFAFLETKVSCIGQNFKPGVNCFNCTACTGVRDVAEFGLGGAHTIAKPSNVAADTGINCDRNACPFLSGGISPYQGPMGYEGHCESLIASSANWDLAQSLVAHYGATAGWAAMDSIWYKSLTPSKSAYQVVSGGKCNPAATVNGCGSTNWYTVFLAADDNDGNLANGTPNGCRIWDAFNAHGIACGTRPLCTS
ncbi:MAG: hypothetical protein QOJ16_713 [Acidobacteriota bacterium]|nr:hypothetical protein [Acidobacteriota bacterium]